MPEPREWISALFRNRAQCSPGRSLPGIASTKFLRKESDVPHGNFLDYFDRTDGVQDRRDCIFEAAGLDKRRISNKEKRRDANINLWLQERCDELANRPAKRARVSTIATSKWAGEEANSNLYEATFDDIAGEHHEHLSQDFDHLSTSDDLFALDFSSPSSEPLLDLSSSTNTRLVSYEGGPTMPDLESEECVGDSSKQEVPLSFNGPQPLPKSSQGFAGQDDSAPLLPPVCNELETGEMVWTKDLTPVQPSKKQRLSAEAKANRQAVKRAGGACDKHKSMKKTVCLGLFDNIWAVN